MRPLGAALALLAAACATTATRAPELLPVTFSPPPPASLPAYAASKLPPGPLVIEDLPAGAVLGAPRACMTEELAGAVVEELARLEGLAEELAPLERRRWEAVFTVQAEELAGAGRELAAERKARAAAERSAAIWREVAAAALGGAAVAGALLLLQ